MGASRRASSKDPSVSLLEAADQLGVHYMTAYRYVRTGRLAAHKLGSQWRVVQADLDHFIERAAAPAVASTSRRSPADHTERLVSRLVAGDEGGAWTVVQRALAGGLAPATLYLDVLGPALREIGDQWASGQVTVAQEHQASMVTLRLLGRLGPLFTRPGRSRGSVVVGAPAGDTHSLPTALFADLLRGEGLAVVQLGADTPPDSFVEAARAADRLVAVGVTATLSGNEEALAATVEALHDAHLGPVVVGGRAVDRGDLAERLGADHHPTSTPDAVALLDDLADQARRARRRQRRTTGPRASQTTGPRP
jgi:MerR family transcriptional regulator, light-induced transcriptional regulator